jgi:hypothetical protein
MTTLSGMPASSNLITSALPVGSAACADMANNSAEINMEVLIFFITAFLVS